MASTPVPTLSASGWVKAINEKADFVLAHFFEADAFQTLIYQGNITSLQFLLEQNGNNPAALLAAMRETVSRYFARYFDTAQIDCQVQDDEQNKLILRLYGTVTENGKEYSFAELLETSGNRITRITKLNN